MTLREEAYWHAQYWFDRAEKEQNSFYREVWLARSWFYLFIYASS